MFFRSLYSDLVNLIRDMNGTIFLLLATILIIGMFLCIKSFLAGNKEESAKKVKKINMLVLFFILLGVGTFLFFVRV